MSGGDGSPKKGAVCVFCGAAKGNDPQYAAAARDLGRDLAGAGIRVIYGGGQLGLMGTVADAALAAGGVVTGIIPLHLDDRERRHPDLTELVVVGSMHERKRLMFDRSDAFVVLPGGFGTMDELIEMTTWSQLGLHTKPIVLVDVAGFWKPMIVLLDHLTEHGFVSADSRRIIRVVDDIEDVLSTIGLERRVSTPVA